MAKDPTILDPTFPAPALVATMTGALVAVCPKCSREVELTQVTVVPEKPLIGAPSEQTNVDYTAYYKHLATHKE